MLIAVSFLGFGVWIASLVKLLRPAPDARTAAVLDDELTRHNRHRAFTAGYWLMLVTAAGALLLGTLVPLPLEITLRVLLVVGVAAPLLRFVVLEARDGG